MSESDFIYGLSVEQRKAYQQFKLEAKRLGCAKAAEVIDKEIITARGLAEHLKRKILSACDKMRG